MTNSKMKLLERVSVFSQVMATLVCSDECNKALEIEVGMVSAMQMLQQIRAQRAGLFIIGNGGSAAVASHAQIDFINVANLNACVLHEPAVLTCMSNDYGYENAYERLVEISVAPMDLLIAISSSGQSKNIINATRKARALGALVMTLTGFKMENPLRQQGHLNFWLASSDYGFVEIGHQFILHNLSDRFGELKQSKNHNNLAASKSINQSTVPSAAKESIGSMGVPADLLKT